MSHLKERTNKVFTPIKMITIHILLNFLFLEFPPSCWELRIPFVRPSNSSGLKDEVCLFVCKNNFIIIFQNLIDLLFNMNVIFI